MTGLDVKLSILENVPTVLIRQCSWAKPSLKFLSILENSLYRMQTNTTLKCRASHT